MTWSDLPRETIRRHDLNRRIHVCGGQREVRFLLRDRSPRIPIWRGGRLLLARWGNTRHQSRVLPAGGCLLRSEIADLARSGESVDIPATTACDGGVWYNLREGIRGLLVPDEAGWAVCYVLCVPATHVYKNMTKSPMMPDCIGGDF